MLFSFTGCSGSGKTTLGKFLEENYLITYKEVSARPFLEDLNKSYDEQMTDKIQNRIMYGNLEMVYENLIESQKENIILSRCCIDVLAYARILKHGLDCEYLQEKTIKKLSDKMVILYTIPDFPLTDVDDKLIDKANQTIQEKGTCTVVTTKTWYPLIGIHTDVVLNTDFRTNMLLETDMCKDVIKQI